MRPLYIFDLDGTLALNEHRQHLLDNKDDPERWDKFFDACDKDAPNWPVIQTLGILLAAGAEVHVWSGRSDAVVEKTAKWLGDHLGQVNIGIRMRKAGDFTPDEELKGTWLDELAAIDRHRLIAVFDDRDKVVNMWRAKGVACFQVAKGDF